MDKSITLIESQVEKCETTLGEVVVNSQESYDHFLEAGKKVSKLLKLIDEDEKKITKPINDSLKLIRDKYRPFKERVEAKKKEIAKALSDFINAEEAKKRTEEARIAARVEKGTMKEETAVNKLNVLQDTKTDTSGGMTSVLVCEVIDIKDVPAEYLIVNEAKAKADYREGKEIAGLKMFYEKRARL